MYYHFDKLLFEKNVVELDQLTTASRLAFISVNPKRE
jgi:hypothetical protein